MAKTRKTQDVSAIVAKANQLLALDAFNPKFRQGVIAMVESALFATDNYNGYGFQVSELDPETGALKDSYDDTRRFYMAP